MMKLEDLTQLVVDMSNGFESFPFNKDMTKHKIIWHVVKHQHNQKIYGMVFEKEQKLFLNVKLTTEHGQELRELRGVTPGYHMNKNHWNTIEINNTELSYAEIKGVIQESAQLTQ
ncbi:MmcQ/YjbR family DNA-binding protein [Weissella ceti]|uniref:MmcQ/YjbR family DNA-binding protein n=1 Tax=Weissella ceti TaxID=759620 RepID=A0ABT3E2H2_9LACO|nr:MmcQ/YjbR family DNA-binding protein [Weissella ceti]MCW0952626.1 MmcQ/YjbR family DNA-binding protein [Weissella ceti]QVK12331.1 MmcQ/YjbR family DNA-binding protein [Weissella ceti]